MLYLELFVSFLKIGLFSIGGGMASIPIIRDQIVNVRGWLTLSEFTDLITISEMTPGPIAINSATFVGNQVGGFWGGVVASVASVIPSVIIVMSLAFAYKKFKNLTIVQGILAGIRPAVVALIASAGLVILKLAIWGENKVSLDINTIDFIAVGLFIASLIVVRKFKVNPIFVMLGCGIVGTSIRLIVAR